MRMEWIVVEESKIVDESATDIVFSNPSLPSHTQARNLLATLLEAESISITPAEADQAIKHAKRTF